MNKTKRLQIVRLHQEILMLIIIHKVKILRIIRLKPLQLMRMENTVQAIQRLIMCMRRKQVV